MEVLTKTGITVEEFIRGDLYGMTRTARGEMAELPPEVIADALRSAEDSLEKDLGTFIGRKRVASDPIGRGLDPATWDVEAPAYNYPIDFFVAERWGGMKLDYAPVHDITAFFWAFPGHYNQTFDAKHWVRPDRKFGWINVVPNDASAILLSFNAWITTVLAGSRSLPQSLFIDYSAGIDRTALRRDHNDIYEMVRLRALMALLGTLGTIRSGGLGSCSTSLDGLSQSESFSQGQYGPYSAAYVIAKEREKLLFDTYQDTQVGVQFAVL